MTKIFMVRHGQSMSNIAGTFTGMIDSPLSELGYRQAELCAEYLKEMQPDRLFSSDLDRAYMTGLALGKILGLPVEKLSGFREIDAGSWGGLRFEEIEKQFPKDYSVWHDCADNAMCPGGESVAALQKRVVDSLFSVSKECDGQTVCVFTHATPIRITEAYALGQTIQQTPWPANSSVSEFSVSGSEIKSVSYGFNDFLGESVTFLPDNV